MRTLDTMVTRDENADSVKQMPEAVLNRIRADARSKKRERGTVPENILLQPLKLPRMVNIKNGEVPEDELEAELG